MDDHMRLGIRQELIERSLDRLEKFVTESTSLTFVPAIRLLDVRGRGGPDDDAHQRVVRRI